MEIVKISEDDLKSITHYLVERKIVFHPEISPKGFPNFSNHRERNIIIILDRNIHVKMMRLVRSGRLKDETDRKTIGALLFWTVFNNFSLTSGFAISEHAAFFGNNKEASDENNVVVQILDNYPPLIWLQLFHCETLEIEPLDVKENTQYKFLVEDDHHKLHKLEMLKIAQLQFNKGQSLEDKFISFHAWVHKNILKCKYTTCLAAMIFSKRSKVFSKMYAGKNVIIKKCNNQAWDLTYLLQWSTLYTSENDSDSVYLMCTMDNEMKKLIQYSEQNLQEVYTDLLGKKKSEDILKKTHPFNQIRTIPDIDTTQLDEMITAEEEILERILQDNNQ